MEEIQNGGGDYNGMENQTEEVHEEQLGGGGEDRRQRHDGGGGGGGRDSSQGKIFVGGVSWDTTEGAFTKHFEKYGEIIDSVIMKEKHTKKPRGFGFITFSDPSVLDKVLEDEHIINDRTVEVKRTVPREEMDVKGVQKTKKIFVGGIPPSIKDDDLKEYFSSYGNIVEHQVMLDRISGQSRGFGFVTFESEDVVDSIMGKPHELGGKEVEIKKAEPKRAGGDSGSDSRDRFGGGYSRSHGYGGGAYGAGGGSRSGGGYGGRSASARGYGGYGRGYGGGAGAGAGAGAVGSYGGYGYRGGYGGPMYGNSEYGDDGYGSPGGFGGAAYGAGYYGGGGYGNAAYGGGGGGYGNAAYGSGGGGGGYGNAAYGGGGSGYGNAAYGGGGGGGYGNAGNAPYGGSTGTGKGYGGGAPDRGRYHPYGGR